MLLCSAKAVRFKYRNESVKKKMLLRTMSHFDLDRKVRCHTHTHTHIVVGLRPFEVEQDCYANSQLLVSNRQSALGQFSIDRVGQFSISAGSEAGNGVLVGIRHNDYSDAEDRSEKVYIATALKIITH